MTKGTTKSSRRTKSKKRSAAKSKPNFFKAHSLAVTIAGAIFAAAIIGIAIITLPSYHGKDVMIYIPQTATEASIKDTLKTRLGNAMGNRVYMLWQLQGGSPSHSHGAYMASDGMSAGRLSHRIASGAQTPVRVMFNGTRTLDKLADQLTGNLELSPEDFLKACDKVLTDSGLTRPEFPAAFIPDTYEFYWTITPEQLVSRLYSQRNKFWAGTRLQKAKDAGLTPVQVATVASIVEEETAKADERPKVARLYLNRLNRGMRLQADPTVKFAVGDFSIRRVLHSHLTVDSPYNTYMNKGLPPGPIRIVEAATIDAVLNAPRHDYIYMCAREDFSGYHNFSTEFSQHRQNATNYQAELDRREIK